MMTAEQLKASILQMAMQGKLVEQKKNEESVCLKIVKMTDDLEFDIPEKWITAHIENITESVASKQYQIKESEVKTSGKHMVISQSQEYSIGFSDDTNKLYHHDAPVIVFGDHTTVVKIVDFDFIVGADGVKIFAPDLAVLDSRFFFWEMQYYTRGFNKVGGYSRHYKFIKDKPFVVPPLEEQKRIVAKIEELMPFVEQYAKASTRLNTLNASFPEQMKKSILQQAVMGKLVPQDPNDEPTSVLLKKIAEEKQKLIKEGMIKKQKALPTITEDEIPFDIPESWEFVRLGEVIELLSGIDFKPSEYSDISGKTVYITGASCLSDTGVIEQRWTDTPKNIAYRGDLLLVCKGSGYGKTVICDVDEAHIARQIMAIKKIGDLNLSYIKYFLQSKISEIKRNGQGVIPGIDRGSVLNMILPLPPLEEQQRIVDQIDRLNDYAEGLRT